MLIRCKKYRVPIAVERTMTGEVERMYTIGMAELLKQLADENSTMV